MPHAHHFVLWGLDHLIVLALTASAVIALLINQSWLRRVSDVVGHRIVAVALFVNEAASWILAAAHGVVRVPLQLCDLALLCTVWALWSLQPTAVELTYFWGLAGSLQAVLTPDLQQGFPDYWWMKFFLTHCGVLLSAVYLAVTGRIAPTHRTVWKVFLLTNAYVAAVGIVNWRWGTNYGYLAHKPMQPSVLDYLGPWPYYILTLEIVGLASFYLYYTPFAVANRFSRNARERRAGSISINTPCGLMARAKKTQH